MTKRNKIIYWVSTLWLASGLAATGVQQLLKVQLEGVVAPPGVYGITQLGYPVYLLTIIGVWKLLGVVALLAPRFPLIKEWAYAGVAFLLSGAIISHLSSNSPLGELIPASLLLVMAILSWHFRPAERKIASAKP